MGGGSKIRSSWCGEEHVSACARLAAARFALYARCKNCFLVSATGAEVMGVSVSRVGSRWGEGVGNSWGGSGSAHSSVLAQGELAVSAWGLAVGVGVSSLKNFAVDVKRAL